MTTIDRLNLRLTAEDVTNVAAIGEALRAQGTTFPTRAEAARVALEFAAKHLKSPSGAGNNA